MSVMCCNLFIILFNLGKLKAGDLEKGLSNTSSAKIVHITKPEV